MGIWRETHSKREEPRRAFRQPRLHSLPCKLDRPFGHRIGAEESSRSSSSNKMRRKKKKKKEMEFREEQWRVRIQDCKLLC